MSKVLTFKEWRGNDWYSTTVHIEGKEHCYRVYVFDGSWWAGHNETSLGSHVSISKAKDACQNHYSALLKATP